MLFVLYFYRYGAQRNRWSYDKAIQHKYEMQQVTSVLEFKDYCSNTENIPFSYTCRRSWWSLHPFRQIWSQPLQTHPPPSRSVWVHTYNPCTPLQWYTVLCRECWAYRRYNDQSKHYCLIMNAKISTFCIMQCRILLPVDSNLSTICNIIIS